MRLDHGSDINRGDILRLLVLADDPQLDSPKVRAA
jgi:hypothetical protein